MALSGRSSLVLKVTDSWLVCHEFDPGTAKDPPCRGSRCTLNISRFKHSPVGVVWKLGERMSSSLLDHGSKLPSPLPIVLMQLYSATSIQLSLSIFKVIQYEFFVYSSTSELKRDSSSKD
ncbi:hypothetical protein TNCV_3457011 [Trichonephila clavipes]|nr:hypothetical protein TNCV_3457011 [Trichonephila clavipes]